MADANVPIKFEIYKGDNLVRDEVLARAPGLDPAAVTIGLVGPSVGPHLGPGCVGAAVLYRA